MQNVLTVVAGYLGKISLPGLGVIDIIEIGLISFFVYQFMAWIKFTRAYTLLKGILIVLGFILIAYIFKMNTILKFFSFFDNIHHNKRTHIFTTHTQTFFSVIIAKVSRLLLH